jgi:SsrA-binding protein
MSTLIAKNKKAFHDYFIEEQFEAGMVLEGWEAKAIREGRVQLRDSYVVYQRGAFWLIGCHITPLLSASTHIRPEQTRTRKLLMKRHEIDKMLGKVERSGYTMVALNLHYHKGWVKAQIALVKGKQEHDKRHAQKDREWQIEKQRLFQHKVR